MLRAYTISIAESCNFYVIRPTDKSSQPRWALLSIISSIYQASNPTNKTGSFRDQCPLIRASLTHSKNATLPQNNKEHLFARLLEREAGCQVRIQTITERFKLTDQQIMRYEENPRRNPGFHSQWPFKGGRDCKHSL